MLMSFGRNIKKYIQVSARAVKYHSRRRCSPNSTVYRLDCVPTTLKKRLVYVPARPHQSLCTDLSTSVYRLVCVPTRPHQSCSCNWTRPTWSSPVSPRAGRRCPSSVRMPRNNADRTTTFCEVRPLTSLPSPRPSRPPLFLEIARFFKNRF